MDVDTCRQLADTRDTRHVTMEPPHADPESDTEDTDPTKLLNQWLGELNTLKKVNYSSRRQQSYESYESYERRRDLISPV